VCSSDLSIKRQALAAKPDVRFYPTIAWVIFETFF